MRKTTKGAFAAATAGVLLLGGAGSLAYWTDTVDAPGGTIGAGHLRISDTTTCSSWTYDGDEVTGGATFTPGTSVLVPGDVISRDCDVTVEAEGEHLRATVEATEGTNTGLFAGATPTLTLDVSNIAASPDGGATAFEDLSPQEITETNDGDTLRVTTTVTFAGTADNATQDIDSVLDDITLTATQVHD